MKNTKFFVSTLIAAAAMTATAYAEDYEYSKSSTSGATLNDDVPNNAEHTITFCGASGWLPGYSNGAFSSNIILTDTASGDAAITINNGSSTFGTTQTFSGSISGSGTFLLSDTPQPKATTYIFTGDVTAFTGNINAGIQVAGTDKGTGGGIQFGNGSAYSTAATVTDGVISNISGTGTIAAGNKLTYNYAESESYTTLGIGNSSISAGTLTFQGGASYSVSSNVTAGTLTLSAGTLILDGNTTVSSALSVASGTALTNAGTLDLSGATVSLSSAISNTGTVLIDAFTVFALGEVNTKYDLVQGGGTIDGTIGIHNFSVGGVALTGRSTGTISNSEGVLSVTVTAFNLAESVTWAGTDSSHVWDMNNATNAIWKLGDKDDAFYARDNATFGTEASYKTVTIGGDIVAGTVTVNDDYTFSATADSTLDTGIITVASGKTLTLSAESDKTLTVLATTQGGANLVKSGSGTVNIANTGNSFSSVSVQEGRLELGAVTAEQTGKGLSSIDIASGATLAIVAGNDLVMWAGEPEKNSYSIAGTLELNKSRFSIGGGTINLSGGNISGEGDGHGGLDFFNDTTISVSADSTISANVRVRPGKTADFSVENGSVLNFSGTVIDGNESGGTMKKSGTGTMNFSGTLKSGTLSVAEGLVNFSGTISAGTISIAKDAVVDFGSGVASLGTSDSKLNLSGTGTVKFNFSGTAGQANTSGIYVSDSFAGVIDYVGNLNWCAWGDESGSPRVSVGENATISLSRGNNGGELWGYKGISFKNKFVFATDYDVNVGRDDLTFENAVVVETGTLNVNIRDGSTHKLTFSGDTEIYSLVSQTGASVVLNGGTSAVGLRVDQGVKGNLTIGSGATVTAYCGDVFGYNNENKIRVEKGGTLDLGAYRQSFGANNELVLAGGTLKGEGAGRANSGGSENSSLEFFGTTGTIVVEETTSISNPISLAVHSNSPVLTVNVWEGKTLTVEGMIYQFGVNDNRTSTLEKDGEGVLILNNVTSLSAINVTNGTLEAASLTALGSGNVSVESGATLRISVENVDAGTINLTEGAMLEVDLADFADVLGADEKMLKILTGTTLTFGQEAVAVSDTLTSDQLERLSVVDSSGAFSKYVNKEWAYNGRDLTLTLTIPEPSAFGLLAGVGALALVVSRRRRVKKA